MTEDLNTEDVPSELKDLVLRHQVCWETMPLHHFTAKEEKVQIGFYLELYGTHDHPRHPPDPGCEECDKVYRALQKIAQWIMPKQETASQYEIEAELPALVFSPRRKNRTEVKMVIKIMHRSGFERPVDACEITCIQVMEDKLRRMGARREHWK